MKLQRIIAQSEWRESLDFLCAKIRYHREETAENLYIQYTVWKKLVEVSSGKWGKSNTKGHTNCSL